MDRIECLLLEAWDRIGAKVRADRLEALRRSRRQHGVLSQPVRAWSLRIRASDTRINDYTALIDPPGAVAAKQPHRVTIDGKLIRRLTEPVRIPRPGVTYHEVAALLGREYHTVAGWARRGVLEVDHYPRFRRPNRGAPMVWTRTVIDPNALCGRPPHLVWGTLWQTLSEQLPENYEMTAYRVPRFRIDPRGSGRELFHGWYFICPGRLARCERSTTEITEIAETRARGGAGAISVVNPREAPANRPCGRGCNYLFGPQSMWTLPQALGEETGFDMPEHSGLAGQWFPGSAESDPTRARGMRSFACWKCWDLAGETWAKTHGWNQFVSHISGGLLYGREVPRPMDLVPYERQRAYVANPNMRRSRKKHIRGGQMGGQSAREVA